MPDRRRTDGRRSVLRAAVVCMNAKGYAGTTIRDIAAAAGVSSAALYHHFPSKQHILLAVMTGALEDAARLTGAAVDGADPTPTARLEAAVGAWVAFHATRSDEALIGATELRSLDPANRAAVVRHRDRQERLFRSIVAEGIRDGSFALPSADHATRAIITMGTAVASWFDPGGPDPAERVADEYARLALRMVSAASPPSPAP